MVRMLGRPRGYAYCGCVLCKPNRRKKRTWYMREGRRGNRRIEKRELQGDIADALDE